MAENDAPVGETVTRGAPRPPNFFTRYSTDGWAFEILSTFFGTILIILLCALLRHYDGQPVPSFGSVLNTDITLNFAVSLTLSVAIPALMFALDHLETFDEASRGIAGGARFLWKMRARPFASIGAFLAIFQLIVGPLAQNALLYPLEAFEDDNSANATALINKSWSDTNDDQLVTSAGDPSDISMGMIGAIQRGIFTGGSNLHPLPPSCSTGNCTIGPYRSLGVCSSSANVTSSLTVSTDDHLSTVKLSLPGGAFLLYKKFTSQTEMKLVSVAGSFDPKDPNNEAFEELRFSDSIAFKDTRHPIADVFIIYLNSTDLSSIPIGKAVTTSTPAAIEFVLEWCVQTLQSTVRNGIATTQVLESYRDFEIAESLNAYPPPASSDIHRHSTYGSQYSVSMDTHTNYQRYFQTLLDGAVHNVWPQNPEFLTFIATSGVVGAFFHPFNPGAHNRTGKSHVKDQKGLDALLDNVAMSMTNEMRSSDPSVFRGVVTRQRTVVRVQWPFLIAPIIFMALCILFFGGTLGYQRYAATASSRSSSHITSGQQGTPIRSWKSSSLAVLRALDPDLQERLGAMSSLSALQRQAQSVTVGLRVTGERNEGVRLIGVGKESESLGPEPLPRDGSSPMKG